MSAAMEATPVSTTVEFPRFGSFSYTESEVLAFPWGIPGFPALHSWLALTLPTQPNFVWLQSLDDIKVAIPTCDPYFVFESYDPRLPGYAVAALEIADPSDFTMLCVMVATAEAEEMTMNLMAPIVVNLKSRKARQVMLENSGYSIKERIPRKVASGATDGAPATADAPQ